MSLCRNRGAPAVRFVAWVTEFTASMAAISPAARSVESFFASGPCAAEPSPGHPSPEEFPMSSVLYRLGRFAARRPWLVIGLWFLLAAAVVIANSTVGRDFEDAFTVPGQDSDDALVLLEAAQLDAAGVSAQLVIASVVP
ncbi:MAG: hypothetical protein EBY44_03855, partial [Actinobacteria bacterium]|nr:hypothetical protein [Actinomycetota bacterium]